VHEKFSITESLAPILCRNYNLLSPDMIYVTIWWSRNLKYLWDRL
jgi:hypothetical protein